MKNTYLLGYFPLISILLFSLSFAVYGEIHTLDLLKQVGIYQGMLAFFSVTGIKLTLLFGLFLIVFMLFAALKLIADTAIEISLLFFSKESEGESLRSIRACAVIYLIGGAVSLISIQSILGILAIFLTTTFVAFIFFVYKISPALSGAGLIGIIVFHVFGWSAMLSTILYCGIKLYNSIIASMPL